MRRELFKFSKINYFPWLCWRPCPCTYVVTPVFNDVFISCLKITPLWLGYKETL